MFLVFISILYNKNKVFLFHLYIYYLDASLKFEERRHTSFFFNKAEVESRIAFLSRHVVHTASTLWPACCLLLQHRSIGSWTSFPKLGPHSEPSLSAKEDIIHVSEWAWNHCQTPIELSSILQNNCSFFLVWIDYLNTLSIKVFIHTSSGLGLWVVEFQMLSCENKSAPQDIHDQFYYYL